MAGVAVSRPAPIHLHIGAMKTGTTYLQQVMAQNKKALAEAGVCFPGETWADQVRAAHDVLGHHRDRGVRQRATGAWADAVGEMLAHEGAASVLSVEFLSFADTRAARRVVRSLGTADVHVVLTVRDTGEVLPGLWQTHCANGGTVSWPTFAAGARRGAVGGPAAPLLGQGARLFRRALDIPRMLEVWASVVPPERLHVVTVPPAGSPKETLWERFAGVVGVDPAVAVSPPRSHNPSLGYASADLMRRLNAALGRLPRSAYNPTLKHYLAEEVLAARAGEEDRARLDVRGLELAQRWNRRTRAALEAAAVHVVGDLEDLPTTTPQVPPPEQVAAPETADLLDAATAALSGMQRLIRRRTARVHKLGGAAASRAEVVAAETRCAAWQEAPDPVGAAVSDLANETRAALALHDQLRHLRD